jgi:hypothetical protein
MEHTLRLAKIGLVRACTVKSSGKSAQMQHTPNWVNLETPSTQESRIRVQPVFKLISIRVCQAKLETTQTEVRGRLEVSHRGLPKPIGFRVEGTGTPSGGGEGGWWEGVWGVVNVDSTGKSVYTQPSGKGIMFPGMGSFVQASRPLKICLEAGSEHLKRSLAQPTVAHVGFRQHDYVVWVGLGVSEVHNIADHVRVHIWKPETQPFAPVAAVAASIPLTPRPTIPNSRALFFVGNPPHPGIEEAFIKFHALAIGRSGRSVTKSTLRVDLELPSPFAGNVSNLSLCVSCA